MPATMTFAVFDPPRRDPVHAAFRRATAREAASIPTHAVPSMPVDPAR